MTDTLDELHAKVAALTQKNAELNRDLADRKWLKDAVDAVNNTVIVADPHQPDTPIVYANRGFEQLTGYSAAETLGRNCRFLQGDDTDQPEITLLREAVRAGQSIRVVLRNYRKDGTMFWNELHLTAVYREGQLTHFIGVQNDVTQFVEAEEERALLAWAVEQADESILITDAELEKPGPRISYVNAAFEKLTGYSRDEVLGETPRLLQGPKTDPAPLRRLRRTLEAGKTFRGETINYRKNGEVFVNEWNVAPLAQGGRVTHWVATQRDVSERRELERLVLEASALEQQRVAQDLHDTLGQHLTGTAFLAASLAKSLRTAGQGADVNVTAAHCAEAVQVTTLINKAIAQTRALARGLYPVELQRGLAGALETLCHTTETVYGASCTFLTIGQPQANAEEAVHLYRIAQEALNNAFRHGRAKTLTVHWAERDGLRRLSVTDDGSGFPATGSPPQEQQGLGLRIMRYRAQLIGGHLTVTSAARADTGEGARGTVVCCTLTLS